MTLPLFYPEGEVGLALLTPPAEEPQAQEPGTQTGGTNTVSETLTVANQAGSSGVYHLEGGSLSAASEYIRGSFSQSGGTLASGSLVLAK
jgi:hypothetical protein